MSSTTDKIKGVANEVAGKAKQATGDVTGSGKLKAEGLAQQAKGEAQKSVGQAKDAVADFVKK